MAGAAEPSSSKADGNSIKVYLRLRPTTKAFVGFKAQTDDDLVDFELDRDQAAYINNTKVTILEGFMIMKIYSAVDTTKQTPHSLR